MASVNLTFSAYGNLRQNLRRLRQQLESNVKLTRSMLDELEGEVRGVPDSHPEPRKISEGIRAWYDLLPFEIANNAYVAQGFAALQSGCKERETWARVIRCLCGSLQEMTEKFVRAQPGSFCVWSEGKERRFHTRFEAEAYVAGCRKRDEAKDAPNTLDEFFIVMSEGKTVASFHAREGAEALCKSRQWDPERFVFRVQSAYPTRQQR